MNEIQKLAREAELMRYGANAERLHNAVSELGPDEVDVLAFIAERLVMGKKQYGDLRLATDRRDWAAEASAEWADAAVYSSCALLSKAMKAR